MNSNAKDLVRIKAEIQQKYRGSSAQMLSPQERFVYIVNLLYPYYKKLKVLLTILTPSKT